MKKSVFFCILALSIVFSSCKKNAKTVAPTTSILISYAKMTAGRSYFYNTGVLTLSSNSAYAEFRPDINQSSTDMQIGSVSAAGVGLKFQPSSKLYFDTTYSLAIVPTTWRIVGAGSVPSFTYTNNDSLPAYTGYALLPDTIDKSQNLTIQVNGISNADAIEVSLYNPTITNNLYQYRSTGITTNNTFSCTASKLAPLPVGTSSPTLLIISVFKTNTQSINGATCQFVNQYEIDKVVYIK